MIRSCCLLLAAGLLCGRTALASPAQQPDSQAAQRSEIYHVHFTQAAPGKSQELGDFIRTPPPNAPNPGHALVLRHAEGDTWDFVVIQHIGPKATIEAGSAQPTPARELRAWHEDTHAGGPSWDVFSRATGITGQPAQSATDAVYVVTTYRGAPGHRAQLEQTLQKLQAAASKPEAVVILQHFEGGTWDFLVISRYDSWQALAADQTDGSAEQRERRAGLTRPMRLELREHMAAHHDTIAVRVPLQAGKPAE